MGLFIQAESREEKLLVSALRKGTDCAEAHCRRCPNEAQIQEKTKPKVRCYTQCIEARDMLPCFLSYSQT